MSKKVSKPIEKKNLLIKNLDDLREFLATNTINTMERVMAINLLLDGREFYAQYRVDFPDGWTLEDKKYFIADFYIPRLSTIIETDGKGHLEEEQWRNDMKKNNIYATKGYYVLRFTWDDVMKYKEWNTYAFLDEINNMIDFNELRSWKEGYDVETRQRDKPNLPSDTATDVPVS